MWSLIYLYVFCFSLLLSLLLTPWAKRLALRFKVLDYPGERKLQDKPMPLLGGLAIFLAFLVTIVVNILILLIIKSSPGFLNLFPSEVGSTLMRNLPRFLKLLPQLIGILLGGTVILLLGLIDDMKGLRPDQNFGPGSGNSTSDYSGSQNYALHTKFLYQRANNSTLDVGYHQCF